MLKLLIPAGELWNDKTQEFVYLKEQTLLLEHSLVSLSKWESKWKKPFLSSTDKTEEETLDYIRCMTLTKNVDPHVYENLSADNIEAIKNYIWAPMTATTFSKEEPKGSLGREIVTAELVYYWLIALNIPFECQKWHLNRLLTLIRVCNIKNQPPKKMSQSSIMRRNASLNAARRKRLNTRG